MAIAKLVLPLCALTLAFLVGCNDGAGVAISSIDLGSEWVKVGLVKPGVPMDIVLNRESKRKTLTTVAFRKGERSFSSPALNIAIKWPELSFRYLTPLIGQSIDSPSVKSFLKRFPYHKIEADPERNTVVFRLDEETTYSVEELIAMILQESVAVAEVFAEQPISGVVLTVPPFYSQAERKSLLSAAKMTGANIMQLINSNTAVAINYGVFRRKEFNETEQNIMFYDMGATSTIATIVGYCTSCEDSKQKDPQLKIKSVGYDRSLGGSDWDFRLRDHLLKLAKEKVKGDIESSTRAMSKLHAEAKRVKTILSANTEMVAQIEGLFNDQDFRVKVTRAELETMTEDLFARVEKPITDALEAAAMKMEDLDQLIIVGGGTRIPKIQDILVKASGKELGKSINADEAATLGASYQAAVLSKAFRVKTFIVKDANLFPISVSYNRTTLDDDGTTFKKYVSKEIFPRHGSIPSKKVLAFKREREDFNVAIGYSDLTFLAESEQELFKVKNLSSVSIKGISDVLSKHPDDTLKEIKAAFRIDESGILNIAKADAYFELPVVEEPEEPSTLESLGQKISGFFNGEEEEKKEGDDAKDDATEAETKETTEGDTKETEEKKEEIKEEEKKESDESSEKKEGEEKEDDQKEPEKAGTPANSTEAKANETIVENKLPPKPKVTKESLVVEAELLDLPVISEEKLKLSQEKLSKWLEVEATKRAKEQAKNTLETFIYTTKDALYREDIEKVSTEEERDAFRTELSEASDWLEFEAPDDAAADVFIKKADGLNKTAKAIFYRAAELTARPAAIARLAQAINMTQDFIIKIENSTANVTSEDDTPPWIRPAELLSLSTVLNDTIAWLGEKTKKQSETKLTEEPVLKSSAIETKSRKLERELVYLINKPKPKPKPKKIVVNGTANGTNGTKIDINGTKIEINGTDVDVETEDEKPVPAPEADKVEEDAKKTTDEAHLKEEEEKNVDDTIAKDPEDL